MQKVGSVTETADSNGEFTNGNVAQGVPPTILLAEIFNTWQRELVNIVEGSGMELDPNDFGQLLKAINKSVGGGRLLRTSIYTKSLGVQYVSVDGSVATQNKATQFTALSGTAFVEIECQGGGAGGGGVSADGVNPAVGGGGGGGAYGLGRYSTGFSSLIITVGDGGAGGAVGNNYGQVGGTSSAGMLISSPGGYTGAGGSPLVPPFINGGSQVSDDAVGANLLKINGGNGNYGIAIGGQNAAGGNGGASKFGAGAPSTSNRPGYAAKNHGAGGAGAGAYSTSKTGFAGGDGAAGIVIIREFS
ncbi:phage tail protein [Klebsiella aerogenes]|uniref:glycine-rich domain-containing protein n=1 Tax=Klebsiella aerogenes TaxID=548 RepID=UPI002A8334B9|nr:phage tail protein [Klebsiella aerogenes]WPR95476.1 phage tail protein [Klebsiella aerogenes]